MRKVIDKINYEYEMFFLEMMHKSREHIFAQSKEIEIKKYIVKKIRRIESSLDDQMVLKFTSLDNIMEHAYRFMTDYFSEDEAAGQIELPFEQWIETL